MKSLSRTLSVKHLYNGQGVFDVDGKIIDVEAPATEIKLVTVTTTPAETVTKLVTKVVEVGVIDTDSNNEDEEVLVCVTTLVTTIPLITVTGTVAVDTVRLYVGEIIVP